MPDTKWEIQIQGRVSDLEYLASHFTAPPLKVSKDERDDCYLLQSASFVTCTNSQAVTLMAAEQLANLSGALRFVGHSKEPLRLGSVYRRHTDGHRDVFVHIGATFYVHAGVDVTLTVTDSDGCIHPPAPPKVVTIMHLALIDPAVAKALRLLALDAENWVDLYRLYEVVAADVGGERSMIKRGWSSEVQQKRFKHSANSVTVAGDAARHGQEKHQPPSAPMSLDDATAYVKSLLHAWLSSKGA